jgi:hypothetical protein
VIKGKGKSAVFLLISLNHGTIRVLGTHIEAARSASKLPRRNLAPAALLGGRLWPRIVEFLQAFDPIQVRYAGNQFRFIVDVVGYGARQTGHVSRSLCQSSIF